MVVQPLLAQHHGQELVEGDVLEERHVDVPRLLEDRLVAPVRVEAGQLPGYQVVVPDHECVQHAEHRLLVDPRVSGAEAEDVLRGADAALVRVLQREGQQVQQPAVPGHGHSGHVCHVCHVSRVQHNSPEHRQRLHEAALVGPEVVQLGGLVGVHHVTVQHGGDLGRMT